MSIVPLSPGGLPLEHKVAFATPVREAGGAPHWVTLHAEGSEEGTCHILIGGNGAIQAGPKSLVGQHIAALASHPSVSKAQHHPVGHEPPGARDHPHYAEAAPKPPVAPGEAGSGEAPKRPGKPYARLSGAEQGTRQEQIGKALGEAQEAARGASQKAEAERVARRRQMADEGAARNRDVKSAGHQAFIGEHEYFHLPSGDLVRAPRDRRLDENGHRVGARDVAPAHRADETLRQHIADAGERGQQVSGPAAQRNAIADTAVAHQQAQADLAAHRAKADRNPNPWAPHLSPPVGDAKDRELAEKATRAQLAHQAAQAQQQGAQAAEQAEGQRAHEKDMVRLKAEAAQPKPEVAPLKAKAAPAPAHDEAHVAKVLQAHAGKDTTEQGKYRDFMQRIVNGDTYRPTMQDGRPLTKASAAEALRRMNGEAPRQATTETSKTEPAPTVRPSTSTDKPWDYVSPAAQQRMDAAKAEQASKKAEEDRRNLEGALIHNASYAHHAFTRDRAQAHAAMQDRLMAEHREKHGDEANGQLKDLMDTARYAGRRYEGYRNASELVRQDVDAARQRQQQPKAEPKGAFSAPGAKETPQTAPQPEQAAGAPVPSPQHREALRDGRRLLAQKALDPEAHKAKVDAAVHKATAADAFEGARVGYARHGSEYAQRLAHLEAASHYQNHADALQRQHLALTNQDTGGALGKAQRHIEVLAHHEQRAQGQTHPESDQQARELLARSQAIGRHYTSAVQRLNAKAQEHRDAHKRLSGAHSWVTRESATPAPRFSTPAAR